MSFTSLADFLAMGGYAPYVWTCYGATLLTLVVIVAGLRRQKRRLVQAIRLRLPQRHGTTPGRILVEQTVKESRTES